MKLDFAEISGKFESMATRERVLLFLFAIIGPICVWDYAYLTPLEKKQDATHAQVSQLRDISQVQEVSVQSVLENASTDPDHSVRERLARLSNKYQSSQAQLKALTKDLITPEQMATVLQDLLRGDSGLRLISLENLPTVALNGVHKSDEEAIEIVPVVDTSNYLYEHSLQMEFEGSFKAAQSYLQAVEKMPWQLYWDAIEFEVIEYPMARVRVKVHTLSLGEGWIGV